MAVSEKQVIVQCGIGSISMLIFSHIYNAANSAIAKNSWHSCFKKFEVFFSRKQQGAIRTDWKFYSCIFYHLRIMVTICQVANSFSIFEQQCLLWHNTENRWKVIRYLLMLIEHKSHNWFSEPCIGLNKACSIKPITYLTCSLFRQFI